MGQILTIGHSTHDPEAFVALLRGQDVEALADVRRYPSSRRMPWFGAAALEAALGAAGIRYLHLPELGGRRDPLPVPRTEVGEWVSFRVTPTTWRATSSPPGWGGSRRSPGNAAPP